MQIKHYHILIFIGVIVTASVLVFPDRHFIVSQLIESGRLSTARNYINQFTREQPDDALLFIMSSNIHLIEGRPDKAIDVLKPFLSHQNVSKDHLLRLAQLYEWERDPKNALSVLERTVEVFPHDIHVWNRLINYYRYFGLIEDEVRGIIGLTQLNNKISQKNFFLRIIDPKMLEIADLYLKSKDPMTAYLLSKLHIVRNNLVSDIDDQSLSEKDKKTLPNMP
ncbi:MAG: hypothetical protein OMM_03601 [Candidatus Magnetoglobus multicellularis str. Araruama]|uniref:Uncharacterized protein n=1 Tax=Candidatus Magnetoglobus multicellularis str. Araruama TaxID=890399 RepID=A0A1V1P4V7_9BACT|nr:MAG: hypothetical protein OMM_03601 [Candidatus Magnetoglobus multicellularis str. Araruama]